MPRFVLTDESLDGHSERVLMSGADLSRFMKNPVMLFRHDSWDCPIGTWENIKIEGDKITADANFDMSDPVSEFIAKKVENGFLKACSIGFRVVERSEDPELMLPGQKYPTITKWKLLEASIVPIGSNENALIEKELSEVKFKDLKSQRRSIVNQNNTIIMKDKICKTLGLPEDATEEQITEALEKKMSANVEPLSTSVDPAGDAKYTPSEKMIDALMVWGKTKGLITDHTEAAFRISAKSDYLKVYDMIDNFAGEQRKSINSYIQDAKKEIADKMPQEPKPSEKFKNWADLEKNNPDELLRMYENGDADEIASKYLKEVLEANVDIFKK